MSFFTYLLKKWYNCFIEDYYYWVLWVPVLLGIGILCYLNLYNEPSLIEMIVMDLFSMIVVFMVYYFSNNQITKVFVWAFPIICAGFTIIFCYVQHIDTKFVYPRYYKNITGIVKEIQYYPKKIRLILQDVHGVHKKVNKIRISTKNKLPENLGVGDKIQLSAYLNPPNKPVAPLHYNFAMLAYFQNISGVGYTVEPIILLKQYETSSITYYIEKIRNQIRVSFEDVMHNKVNSQIASALIIGKKEGIEQSILQEIRESGLAHLLAISGLHLSIVAGFFFVIIRLLLVAILGTSSCKYDCKKFSAIFSIIFSFIYLLLSGAPVSAQRSFIMISMVFLAIIINRTSINLRSVSVAATLILLYQPEAIIRPSFQMSFIAVISLIAVHNYIKGKFSRKSKTFYFIDIIISSLASSLATTPYTVFHFNQISIAGIISNLIAIPLTTFIIMPAGIMFTVLHKISEYANIFAYIMEQALNVLMMVVRYVNEIPYHAIYCPKIAGEVLLLFTLGFLWLSFWQSQIRLFGIPIIICSIVLSLYSKNPDVLFDEKVAAVQGGDKKLYFLNSRIRSNFVTQNWMQQFGQNHILKHTQHNNTQSVMVECNKARCIYTKHSARVLFLYYPTEYECDQFQYIIHMKNINENKQCLNAILYKDIKESGAYAMYLVDNKVINVQDSIGNRPWT